MGAPSEIAAAHRRRSAFDGDNTGRDHKAAQIFDSQDSGKASIAAQEGRRQCDHAFKCSDVEAHRLHLSFSGTLSNCSETCRADSISAMELQSSYDFSEEDIKAGNTLIEDRRYVDTPNTLAATDEFSSFHHEQSSSKHPAVQWQQRLQRQSNLAHSPHHHSAAAPGSCLKQRPEGFTFWFSEEAQMPDVAAAPCRPFQGCIKSIEGKQRLQQSTKLHVGSKRSRTVSFN